MNRLNRLLRPAAADRGFTLIEVLIAMMVFAIVAVLVAYSLTLSMTLTRSSRAAEVAANLAAQQIDIARSQTDVFAVKSGEVTQDLDGTRYTITKSVGWVTSTGAASDCGGPGILQNKTFNVSVKWTGMRPNTAPVQASTLIAPAGPINDPSSGTIIVHVTRADGSAAAGIPVSAVPDTSISPNSATTITPGPVATDADGCSYVLKVVPGSYVVTIGASGDNRLTPAQATQPATKVPVYENQSAVVELQYDTRATPAITLAPGAPLGVYFPRNLPLTLKPTGDPTLTTVSVTGGTASSPAYKASTALFPAVSGYDIIAGAFVAAGSPQPACDSVDPLQWSTPNASGNVGQRAHVTTEPGSANPVTVPMALITLSTSGGLGGKWVRAISAAGNAASGDPGCDTGMTLKFAQLSSSGNSLTLALPYGSWKLVVASNDTTTTTTDLTSSAITLPAGSPAWTSSTIFTLDPRQP
ncbi:prepilin-type N-terminal cleavage/methylation domain-containing protein [Leifsonia sp. F6_8S_P_1B]|uniref:Prepilin-type N-terminal cleavage/methylation domain-containing protein n=1 Tax=Leifsonia williamsii TaxID=3035919 RepID=A0ABT8KFL2_9MICO|nr:prepilin-type N-terminal cleavage/methylation domain-containing protein [Leifsonia williamsii]MDN4616245.1 prepilin-type N-terminal cleavage/methylation domain-containing protein [Leifsonia williamsii]